MFKYFREKRRDKFHLAYFREIENRFNENPVLYIKHEILSLTTEQKEEIRSWIIKYDKDFSEKSASCEEEGEYLYYNPQPLK